MKKYVFSKILLYTGISLAVLVIVLGVHIYLVTRPVAMNKTAVAMARIDVHQPINQDDAAKIGAWLYRQNGVDHVLCNPQNQIVVFTFHPVVTSADKIVAGFKSEMNYPQATRFMPTTAQLQSGCPAMGGGSFTSRLYNAVKHII